MITMKRTTKNKQGVITVLISLMLAGILSFGTLVMEAGRLQGARTQLDDANISAATSLIASYNSTLYDRYGLLAIDNEMFNVGRYKSYLEFNSDRASGYKGNNISTFYTVKNVELEGLYNLTYPSVLKRQLLYRAKLHIIPQDYSFNYYNMDYFIWDYQTKAKQVSEALKTVASGEGEKGKLNDIPADMQSALKNLYGVFSKIKKHDPEYNVTIKDSDVLLLPSKTGTKKHTIPAEDIKAINNAVKDANTVIGSNSSLLNSNNGTAYNEIDITFNTSFASNLIADFADLNQLSKKAEKITSDCRKMVQNINSALNMLNADKEGNLLLNSYIVGYFPSKNCSVTNYAGLPKGSKVSGVDSANFSGACVEYVFSGNSNEVVNQENAYNYIIASRFIPNLHSVITSSPYFDGNNACSVAAHIAWAYYETCADVELLFEYNAVVPMSKTNMILPINNISTVNSAFSAGNFLTAMEKIGVFKDNVFTVSGYDKTNYRDALAFSLWLVPNSTKMLRIADLIQLEMRYREKYIEKETVAFLMSQQNTFCRVKCIGNLNSVLPVISLGGSGEVNGAPIQSIKYIGY